MRPYREKAAKMAKYKMANPPPVRGCAQIGYFPRQYSPAPSNANPPTNPNTTLPVSPIHWLSKASLRKKPMPMTKATTPMRASQLPPNSHSQSQLGNPMPSLSEKGTPPRGGAAGGVGADGADWGTG